MSFGASMAVKILNYVYVTIVSYVVTNNSEKLVASIFRAENGGIRFLQNVVITYPTTWCHNSEDHYPNITPFEHYGNT
jgi:hypothetical protein